MFKKLFFKHMHDPIAYSRRVLLSKLSIRRRSGNVIYVTYHPRILNVLRMSVHIPDTSPDTEVVLQEMGRCNERAELRSVD